MYRLKYGLGTNVPNLLMLYYNMEKCACQYFYEKKLAGGRNLDRPPAFRWTMYRVLLLFLYFASYITVNTRSYLKTREKRHYTARNVRVLQDYLATTSSLLPFTYYLLSTSPAGLAISRTFLTRLPRRSIHCACIITFRFSTAIRTNYFIRVHFHQFIKPLSALFAFVL